MLVKYKAKWRQHQVEGPFQTDSADLERLINNKAFQSNFEWLAVKLSSGKKFYYHHVNVGRRNKPIWQAQWTAVVDQQTLFGDEGLTDSQQQFKDYWGDDWRD